MAAEQQRGKVASECLVDMTRTLAPTEDAYHLGIGRKLEPLSAAFPRGLNERFS
jgi:hypothetical protein